MHSQYHWILSSDVYWWRGAALAQAGDGAVDKGKVPGEGDWNKLRCVSDKPPCP